MSYSRRPKFVCLVLVTLLLSGRFSSPPASGAETPVDPKHTNSLIHEKSPYLRQHAHNPVDWVPWSQEALQRAKKEDKLIFLSIGYSTCHWCHVMERECFEDEEVAELLNRDFVCIKVDREERPDVDDVYMDIAQGLGSGNGWPLTVVMTPDGQPFFAGTYIPKHDKYRILGLMKQLPILVRQVRYGSNLLDEGVQRAQRRIDLLNAPARPMDVVIEDARLDELFERLMMSHDPTYGGFGVSMKFPRPHQLLYLLSYHQRTGNGQALAAVKLTLDRIRAGGIYDQVGYGIHRYATDRIWKVPHFEKMLYDQAQLAMASAECFRASGQEKYRRMTDELFEYVLRDLTSPQGAFYSAEDADSEGEEGKFYLWTADELRDLLTDEQFAAISQIEDIQEDGNWTDGPSGERQPTNILYRRTSSGTKSIDRIPDELQRPFEAARLALFKKRSRRVRPLRDEKILTDLNGLMIASLARGGRIFHEDRYVRAAAKAFDFIDTHLRDQSGRLLHVWYEGSAAVPAFLDDHVFLAFAAIELYKATYDPKYLESSRQLIDTMHELFVDEAEGGYFFTAKDAERLPIRPKKFGDMAVPSGNSVATLVLSELARLSGEPKYEHRAARLERILSIGLINIPARSTLFAVALEYRRRPGVEVVIVGDPAAADTRQMLANLEENVSKQTVTILVKDTENPTHTKRLSKVAPFTKPYAQIGGKATAYVCRNRICQLPTNDLQIMLGQLSEPPPVQE
ncbi:MAG TPA: thioredoxin domain-containing protein [Pirellulaceae bacterium]|nr:thioredoxin domain-containing protein [Pirellulaceae bacterium]